MVPSQKLQIFKSQSDVQHSKDEDPLYQPPSQNFIANSETEEVKFVSSVTVKKEVADMGLDPPSFEDFKEA